MSEVERTIKKTRSLKTLDAYGLSLANRGYEWSGAERVAFDRKVRELKRKAKESN